MIRDIYSQIWFYFWMKFTLLQVILTLNNDLGPWKQDSGSNHLKGWSKILYHTVKNDRKTMAFDKGGNILK